MMGKVLLLSFLLLGLQRPREQATVSITLVDVFGHPIPITVTSDFKLTNRQNRKEVFTSTELTFQNIPYGEYDLDVLAGLGFASARRTVQVNRSDVWVIMSLPTASVESQDARDVNGRITGISRDGLRWVKLVSVYSEFVHETRLDSQGRFRFTNVPFGSYAVIVIKDRRVCDFRLVEVIAEPKDIAIELTATSPCK
jgi:hypothetical protein